MTNGHVLCRSCKNSVSPRLWHHNNIFTNRSIEHICPICGKTMYTSGGGLSIIAMLLISVFVGFMVGVRMFGDVFVGFFEFFGFARQVSELISIVLIISSTFFLIYKHNKKINKDT